MARIKFMIEQEFASSGSGLGFLFRARYVVVPIQRNKFQTKHGNLDTANAYTQFDKSTRPRKLRTIDPVAKITCYQPRVSGKCGALVWIADAVLLHKAFFCFIV